jgi:hypothetical protein
MLFVVAKIDSSTGRVFWGQVSQGESAIDDAAGNEDAVRGNAASPSFTWVGRFSIRMD